MIENNKIQENLSLIDTDILIFILINGYHFRKDGNISYTEAFSTGGTRGRNDSIVINDTLFYHNQFITGDWIWLDGKESINLTFASYYSVKWDVLRLTENELKVEIDPFGTLNLYKNQAEDGNF